MAKFCRNDSPNSLNQNKFIDHNSTKSGRIWTLRMKIETNIIPLETKRAFSSLDFPVDLEISVARVTNLLN